jgi:regulator of protease activity HflC (stomatin/prohibitin superfamily)
LSRPVEHKLPIIFKILGENYDDRILPSICNEVLKVVVANYNAEEIISNQVVILQQINEAFKKRAAGFHVIIDEVSITHLTIGGKG